MKVFLDDLRPTPDGWVRTYTVEETIAHLKTGKVTEISLDHDLGDDTSGKRNIDGYEVLNWIEEQVVLHEFLSPLIHIHSGNAVGVQRMQAARAAIDRAMAKRSD